MLARSLWPLAAALVVALALLTHEAEAAVPRLRKVNLPSRQSVPPPASEVTGWAQRLVALQHVDADQLQSRATKKKKAKTRAAKKKKKVVKKKVVKKTTTTTKKTSTKTTSTKTSTTQRTSSTTTTAAPTTTSASSTTSTTSSIPSPTPSTTNNLALDAAPRFVAYGNYMLGSNTAGTPDPASSLSGLTHYNLAFWVSKGGSATSAGDVTTGSGNAQQWAQASSAVQQAIVQEYHKNGIRLGVAAFGAVDTPQASGNDPVALANTLAAFVKNNNLDGVDVDFEEYDALTDWSGKGASWLIPFTKALRAALPSPQYYITHAPVAPLFTFPNGFIQVMQQCDSLIDYYNVQFYNQNGAYQTCPTLLTQSDVYASSSVFELINKWGVPASKLVLGKPAHTDDANPYNGQPDGYMTPQLEQTCLQQARQQGWRGGAMWWQYKGQLQDVIQPARSALV